MAIGRSNVLRYAREGSFNTKSESFSGKINGKIKYVFTENAVK